MPEPKPKPIESDNDTLLRKAIEESESLRLLVDRLGFGEVVLQFQNRQIKTAVVKQTVLI